VGVIEIKCEGADQVSIDKLKPLQGRLKKLSDVNYNKLKTEILETGFSEPISAWKDKGTYRILNGHQRLATLRKLKDEGHTIPQIPISLVEAKDMDEAKRKVLALTSQYGEMTNEGLKEFIEGTSLDTDKLFDNFNFPEIDTDQFLSEHFPSPTIDDSKDDEVPEVKEGESKVKLGDIWLLGKHRLICGDSTDKATVDRLMAGQKADMVFTDPPYGVSYEGGHFHSGDVNIKRPRKKLEADQDTSIYLEAIPIIAKYCNGPCYVWYAASKEKDLYNAIDEVGEYHSMIVWHKTNATYAALNAQYKQRHEPCVYWKPKGKTLLWCGPTDERTIWEMKRDSSNKLHPTQKPVELAERAIRNHTAKTILDLFGGSGSTLIACEKTDRTCYMSEIDPHYCQVIIDRWEQYTQQQAIKE
jgi:DNA modification methylase